MGNLFLIFLTAVFAVIILYDVLGHRHGKIRRSITDWIFLCLLAVGFTVSAVRGHRKSRGAEFQKQAGPVSGVPVSSGGRRGKSQGTRRKATVP